MIIIGEKINATIPSVKTVIQERNEEKLLDLAQKQADAGARYIDVNVGTGAGSRDDEIAAMKWAIVTIQKDVDTPLCVDSADPAILEAGLESRNGKPGLINSTNAESDRLGVIVPLAVRYKTPLVALAMDEQGIPNTTEERLSTCRSIADFCEKSGLSIENIFFDPLVLPVSTDVKQGVITLETLSTIKKHFPTAKTVMGLSNVSYGLPERASLNAAFLHMAIFAGLDAAIMDPLDEELMGAVKTGEVLAGKDRHCRRYTRTFRKKS
jgi:5-methyltetrahydrofolate--homocysteine methyltransferase